MSVSGAILLLVLLRAAGCAPSEGVQVQQGKTGSAWAAWPLGVCVGVHWTLPGSSTDSAACTACTSNVFLLKLHSAHLLTPLTLLQAPCFSLVSEGFHVEFLVPPSNKASWVIFFPALLCRSVSFGLILLKHYFWFLKHILICSNFFILLFFLVLSAIFLICLQVHLFKTTARIFLDSVGFFFYFLFVYSFMLSLT